MALGRASTYRVVINGILGREARLKIVRLLAFSPVSLWRKGVAWVISLTRVDTEVLLVTCARELSPREARCSLSLR